MVSGWAKMSGKKQTGALRRRKIGGVQWQEENQPFGAAETAVDAREWYYWIAVWRVPADVARPLVLSIACVCAPNGVDAGLASDSIRTVQVMVQGY